MSVLLWIPKNTGVPRLLYLLVNTLIAKMKASLSFGQQVAREMGISAFFHSLFKAKPTEHVLTSTTASHGVQPPKTMKATGEIA